MFISYQPYRLASGHPDVLFVPKLVLAKPFILLRRAAPGIGFIGGEYFWNSAARTTGCLVVMRGLIARADSRLESGMSGDSGFRVEIGSFS